MITTRPVDFSDPNDRSQFVEMLDHYAQGPFGDGKPLENEVRERLAECFAKAGMTFAFFAIRGEEVVGLTTCQEGFSTFRAAPRINIHDIVVHSDHRGQGIGKRLLSAVREDALQRGAYSVTLEVRVDNERARKLYQSFGFEASGPEFDDAGIPHRFMKATL